MTSDLISIIENISRSMSSIQSLFSGCSYLLGVSFFIIAILKLRKIADSRGYQSSGGNMFEPTAYILMGTGLLFLPSVVPMLANTTFGVNNVLQYTSYNSFNYMSSMFFIIRTIGMIWFIRGCVLLAYSSQPGVQFGSKGAMFLIAGVLAMYIETTMSYLDYALTELINATMT